MAALAEAAADAADARADDAPPMAPDLSVVEVAFVDAPDPDNFMMAAMAVRLRACRQAGADVEVGAVGWAMRPIASAARLRL